MKYEVTISKEIDFAPTTEIEEILQNVRTILTTRLGSVPLARDLGLTWEHVDKPLPVAKVLQQAAITEAIEEAEPRVRVESVMFDNSEAEALNGILTPRVIVSIGNDEKEDW